MLLQKLVYLKVLLMFFLILSQVKFQLSGNFLSFGQVNY